MKHVVKLEVFVKCYKHIRRNLEIKDIEYTADKRHVISVESCPDCINEAVEKLRKQKDFELKSSIKVNTETKRNDDLKQQLREIRR